MSSSKFSRAHQITGEMLTFLLNLCLHKPENLVGFVSESAHYNWGRHGLGNDVTSLELSLMLVSVTFFIRSVHSVGDRPQVLSPSTFPCTTRLSIERYSLAICWRNSNNRNCMFDESFSFILSFFILAVLGILRLCGTTFLTHWFQGCPTICGARFLLLIEKLFRL